MSSVEQLNEKFAIKGDLRFYESKSGMFFVEIDNEYASAIIALHGAHVVHFQPVRQEPVLWVSEYTYVKPGKAIRGGIPVCWPWFGPHPSDKTKPAHGFARILDWDVIETGLGSDGETFITFQLTDSELTRQYWNLKFNLQLKVTVSSMLRVELITHNPANAPFIYSGALHSYFNVEHVENIEIHGLDGHFYLDKLDDNQRKLQQGPVTISDATDRVYLNTSDDCLIHDPDKHRIIRVAKEGSRSTVAWNPGMHKAQSMEDFGNDEFSDMVCIESGNVINDMVRVAPGQTHRLATVISIEPPVCLRRQDKDAD